MAVLYFDNLSSDTADAFLADGLTEEIIFRLGQVRRLEVKSRFEVLRFRGQRLPDPPLLGHSLNAAYLVTGSVQRAGEQVRLRAALVRAATRAQVWGEVFDRTGSNLLTVESDIAQEVATAIAGRLLPEERIRLTRPLTNEPVAYEEYLRGKQALNSADDEVALRSALAHFERAIARDTGFAAAFAAEAVVWSDLADSYVMPREAYEQSRNVARRAIARDSLLALPYAMLAYATLTLDFDAHAGERLARRAISLDARNDQAHLALSQVLYAMGRLEESLTEARRAWELDSLFVDNGHVYATTLIRTGHLDSAAAFLPKFRALAPSGDADEVEGILLEAEGKLQSAIPLLNWRYGGGSDAARYVRGLLTQGDTLAARAIIDSMLAARSSGYYNPLALARAFAALGDIDRGVEWLQRAFEERTLWLIYVRRDTYLAPLRADPRYAALDRLFRY